MSENVSNLQEFRDGTMRLALDEGYPVLTESGTFIHDARCAWLIERVEAWMVAEQEPRVDVGWFHASSLGRTDEELIAEYRGEASVDRHGAKTLRVFDLGHDRDRSWKRYLRESGVSTLAVDDPIRGRGMTINWLRLRGECDDIIINHDGKLYVFELKTKAPYLFAKLSEPDEAHVLQVHAYMGGLGIPNSIIMYECKGTQSLKAFYVPFSSETWDTIVARLTRLRAEAEGVVSSEQ